MFSAIFAGRNRALATASQTSVCQEIRNQLFPTTSPLLLQIRTATKRGGGSTKNGRGSIGKRLGVKRFTGQYVIPGNIIVRQRGRQFWPGQAVGIGRDHTLVALQPGYLYFYEHEIPYPHQRPSKLHPQKALDVSKAGSIDDGSKLTRKIDEPKEFPLVKFPRGMKRFVGICRTRDEVLPRDEREEGRERWFWKTDTVEEDSTNVTRPF